MVAITLFPFAGADQSWIPHRPGGGKRLRHQVQASGIRPDYIMINISELF